MRHTPHSTHSLPTTISSQNPLLGFGFVFLLGFETQFQQKWTRPDKARGVVRAALGVVRAALGVPGALVGALGALRASVLRWIVAREA